MKLNGWEEYDWHKQVEDIVNTEVYEPEPPQGDTFPEPVELGDILANPPAMAPVLIDGILRQGHKASLTGPSKAGKSFALMELAIDIAEGMNWMGCRCAQGDVLYINMEIDDASCYNRFNTIYKAMGLTVNGRPSPNANRIKVWGLRGKSMPLAQLTPRIIAVAQGRGYKAIIIDPLYKVMDGDENSNSDVSRMVTYFDRITDSTGASVIYAHHFAKGTGGDRSVIDRGSGAGAFARDPDAIITMTQLDQADDVNEVHTAWRVEFVLREFPSKDPYNVWWEYPLHKWDDTETLADASVETQHTQKARQQERADKRGKAKRIEAVQAVVDSIMINGEFSIGEFTDTYMEKGKTVATNTAKGRLREAGYTLKPGTSGRNSKWIKKEIVKPSK